MKFQTIAFAASFALAACASVADYREAPSAKASGYSEQVIEKDRYRVQYRLASDDSAKARDYALLRAAELTLEKGYSTFEIVSQATETREKEHSVVETGLERDYALTRECGLLTCRTATVPVYTRGEIEATTERGEVLVNLEIQVSNKEASVSPSLYDASEVISNLR